VQALFLGKARDESRAQAEHSFHIQAARIEEEAFAIGNGNDLRSETRGVQHDAGSHRTRTRDRDAHTLQRLFEADTARLEFGVGRQRRLDDAETDRGFDKRHLEFRAAGVRIEESFRHIDPV